MSLGYYFDHHVKSAISAGLLRRGIDVLIALEDGRHEVDDEVLLDRAGEVGRVLFTNDSDFLAIAAHRQRRGIPFTGIVYAHSLHVDIGACIEQLELLAHVYEPGEIANQVIHLWV